MLERVSGEATAYFEKVGVTPAEDYDEVLREIIRYREGYTKMYSVSSERERTAESRRYVSIVQY